MRRALFVAFLAPLLAACGSEDPATPAAVAKSCEAADLEACLENQMQCVVESQGPRCEPCPRGEFANLAGACAPLTGTAIAHEFDELSTQPGEEILGTCRSWTLGNETELWVNGVELEQNQASHHSNWMFSPEDKFPGPDGLFKCKDRGYSQLAAAVAGGALYAQSTQATREVQKFPDGVAVRIPPRSRIISDVHILNTTNSPVTGGMRLAIWVIPEAEVSVKLAPFHLTYHALDIPPQATSRFTSECELESQSQTITGGPLKSQVYYLLPHTHALGSRFFLEVFGGPKDGDVLIDVRGFNGEARGRRYAPPFDLAGATGLRFGCEFENPRSESVGWGFGDQEMCEVLGFAESELAFESTAYEAIPGPPDGAVQTYTGACSTLAFPWSQNKPGGPGP